MREGAMRKLLALCAALLVATPAFAKDIIGNFYGHTMKVTGPTGATHLFHYRPDFTFTENVNGHAYAGHWLVHGYSVCLMYGPPLNQALPDGRCVPIAANHYADKKTILAQDTPPRPLLIHIVR
jgi:hypothetical protein